MEGKVTKVFNVSPSEFKEEILEGVQALLDNYINTRAGKQVNELLTRKEVCKRLSISLPTLRSYVVKGIVPEQRVGRRVLYDWDEVKKSFYNNNTL